jgi:UDP-N-acetylglucosamine:LPS N-acetylglucosamine transferase
MRTLSVLAVTGLLMALPAVAQEHHEEMNCQAMMQQQAGMAKSMKQMDERLDSLVAEMNKARGSAKVDRMAAVITELVAQRTQMRDQMMTMMPAMMEHMQHHMAEGMMQNMSSSMENCPMMKETKEKEKKQ